MSESEYVDPLQEAFDQKHAETAAKYTQHQESIVRAAYNGDLSLDQANAAVVPGAHSTEILNDIFEAFLMSVHNNRGQGPASEDIGKIAGVLQAELKKRHEEELKKCQQAELKKRYEEQLASSPQCNN